jgi:hypothetical protein
VDVTGGDPGAPRDGGLRHLLRMLTPSVEHFDEHLECGVHGRDVGDVASPGAATMSALPRSRRRCSHGASARRATIARGFRTSQ